MKRWLYPTVALLIALGPLTVLATGPEVPAVGSICWKANTESDLAGYRVYVTKTSGDKSTAADVQKTATPAAPCIPRDQTGTADGQYYAGVAAYDTAGNLSGYTETPFFLNAQAPAAPAGVMVK